MIISIPMRLLIFAFLVIASTTTSMAQTQRLPMPPIAPTSRAECDAFFQAHLRLHGQILDRMRAVLAEKPNYELFSDAWYDVSRRHSALGEQARQILSRGSRGQSDCMKLVLARNEAIKEQERDALEIARSRGSDLRFLSGDGSTLQQRPWEKATALQTAILTLGTSKTYERLLNPFFAGPRQLGFGEAPFDRLRPNLLSMLTTEIAAGMLRNIHRSAWMEFEAMSRQISVQEMMRDYYTQIDRSGRQIRFALAPPSASVGPGESSWLAAIKAQTIEAAIAEQAQRGAASSQAMAAAAQARAERLARERAMEEARRQAELQRQRQIYVPPPVYTPPPRSGPTLDQQLNSLLNMGNAMIRQRQLTQPRVGSNCAIYNGVRHCETRNSNN